MRMHVFRTPCTVAQPFSLRGVMMTLRVDGDDDDEVIATMAEAAARYLEDAAQLALLRQRITLDITAPDPDPPALALPVGPALAEPGATVSADGAEFADFELIAGLRPRLLWGAGFRRRRPRRLVVSYEAGFGDEAAAIPADLMVAINDQTALTYDGRSPISTKDMTFSPAMARAVARYRGVSA